MTATEPAADQAMPGPAFALTEALRLARAGYALTPVTIRRLPDGSKRPVFHLRWQKDAANAISSDPDVIRDWAVQHGEDCSFALCCRESGVEGVDLDVKPAAGIDGPLWWSSQGLPMGSLLVQTPTGGLHNIWRRRPNGPALPNGAGQLIVDGLKIRGVDTRSAGGVFFAAGSHVVGDGPDHYQVQGPLPHVADLDFTPAEVLALWGADRAAPNGAGELPTGPLVDRNPFTATDAHAFVTPAWLAAVNSQPGGQNNAINALAMALGHFTTTDDHPGHWTRTEAEAWVLQAAQACGYAAREPGPLHGTMASGLDAGMRQPFPCLVGPVLASAGEDVSRAELDEFFADDGPGVGPSSTVATGDGTTDGVGASSGPVSTLADAFELEVRAELRKAKARRVALLRLAAEDRDPIKRLRFSEYLTAPQVEYLVDAMLWRTGTARIFGPPGETKSFLALDLALSLATGAPWKIGGQTNGRAPMVVHYVMAEGQAVNTSRTLAWLKHHEVDPERAEGTFWAIPQGVLLTPEGVTDYLAMVAEDRPALVILDTKARMMAGDENGPAENFALVRAVDAIKAACEGSVVLVDHTGFGPQDRARGHSSVLAAMDTEIRVTYDRQNGVATAEVTRDKAAEIGRQWQYRLSTVQLPTNDELVTHSAAVPVPMTEGDHGPLVPDRAWQYDELPESVVAALRALEGQHCGRPFTDCPKDGHQRATVAAANNIYRVLRAKAGAVGLTRADIKAELDTAGIYAKTAFHAALNALSAHELITKGETGARFTVVDGA